MSRREKLSQLKKEIDNSIITLTDLLERYENLEIDLDATKKATRKLVFASELTQEELESLFDLYEEWKAGEDIKPGDIRKYNNKLYKAIQAHKTQSDWSPEITPSLWLEYMPAETEGGEEIIQDWKQPLGGHDSYKKGDKVRFEGEIYESKIDNNAHSPAANPQGWEKIS